MRRLLLALLPVAGFCFCWWHVYRVAVESGEQGPFWIFSAFMCAVVAVIAAATALAMEGSSR